MKKLTNPKKCYSSLIADIGILLEQGRKQAYQAVNSILVRTYWEIGKRIVEKQEHFGWGKSIVENLAKDLQKEYKWNKGIFSAKFRVYGAVLPEL